MDVGAARQVLGVDAAASPAEIRAAYRTRLRAAHPDLQGADAGTAEVVAAYRLLRSAPSDEPAEQPPAAETAVEAAAVVIEGDTVTADLPAGELFPLLLDAADAIGDVAYVDRHAGLLEVVVDVAGYGACSVVLTLQGRGLGHTEAWCTAEPLGGGPAPPTEVVTELLAEGLRAVTGR